MSVIEGMKKLLVRGSFFCLCAFVFANIHKFIDIYLQRHFVFFRFDVCKMLRGGHFKKIKKETKSNTLNYRGVEGYWLISVKREACRIFADEQGAHVQSRVLLPELLHGPAAITKH